jgi:hypothetical protein
MIRRLTFFGILIIFLFVSASFLPSQATHIEVVPESVESGTFEVRKGSGKVPVESREFQVKIELPSQKSETLYASMLYDPGTKTFWWQTDAVAAAAARRKLGMPALLPHDSVIWTDSKFVLFWNGPRSGGYIFVLESDEHYSSMDAGQAHVLRALQDRPEFFYDCKRIQLRGLDKDFLFSEGDTAIRVGPKLRDVKRVVSEWQITEDGPNGGSALSH